MERNELERMFARMGPSRQQEEAVLDRLLREERRERPVRRIKKWVVLPAVVVLLGMITCGAASVTGLDWRLLGSFGGTREDEALLSPAAAEVSASHSYPGGWTVTVTQVLADRLSLAVLVDVTAPEGTVLGQEDQLSLSIAQLDEQGERISSHAPLLGFIRQLEDGDPADGRMTVLWQVRKTQGEASVPYPGSAVRLTPCGVRFREGDRMVSVPFDEGDRDSWWSCTVQLPEEDPGITWEMDRSLDIGEARVRLTGVYLSPLSLTFYVEDAAGALRAPAGEDPEAEQEAWEKYWAIQGMDWESQVVLNLRDGTQLTAAKSQGRVGGVSYTFCFDRILDTAEAESVTLFGQTFPLK